jgi:hypothetical protein
MSIAQNLEIRAFSNDLMVNEEFLRRSAGVIGPARCDRRSGSLSRPVKTDKSDARGIAETMRAVASAEPRRKQIGQNHDYAVDATQLPALLLPGSARLA